MVEPAALNRGSSARPEVGCVHPSILLEDVHEGAQVYPWVQSEIGPYEGGVANADGIATRSNTVCNMENHDYIKEKRILE